MILSRIDSEVSEKKALEPLLSRASDNMSGVGLLICIPPGLCVLIINEPMAYAQNRSQKNNSSGLKFLLVNSAGLRIISCNSAGVYEGDRDLKQPQTRWGAAQFSPKNYLTMSYTHSSFHVYYKEMYS